MGKQRTIPNDATSDYVTFDILSEGKDLRPTTEILSISVNKEANRIPTAKIILKDGEASIGDFEISNTDDLIPGKKLEIKAGRDGNNTTIFKGIIVKHGIKIRESGISLLTIEAKDESAKMTIGRHNRYFEEVKDSEAIQTILGEYGLAGDIEATKVTHKEIVQHYSTDWDFMLNKAEVNGLLVFANDGKVDIKAPDTSSSEALTILYGATIIDFEAEIDARYQWSKVVANSWDYAGQTLFESEASAASKFTGHGNLTGEKLSDVLGLEKQELRHGGQVLTEELKAWAEAYMLKSRMSKIRGRAKFEGTTVANAGDTVMLQGLGDRFNGKAYITGIRHELVKGNWFTHVQFGLSPEWYAHQRNISGLPAAGLIPAISGLQVGKVVQLESDPDGEDRILVKLPIIDGQANGVWARVASLDAGNNRGFFFRPEIDDEVIVGFVNADPRDPVVLGMLHSSANPAPIVAADDNHEKGLHTRSEMKVLFNDDTKVITIETPAGNKIVISEEDKSITITDQNQNEIAMTDAGITMTSPKDISLDAQGKINIKAAQDVSIEGLNVAAKAQAEFKADGAAGAKLTTSAIAEIKGSLVKIN